MNVVANPALVPPNELERLAAVRRYDILDTPPDGAFDRITALAARIFDVPIAIVSVVDHDRIWFKSHHGLDLQQVDREAGLCASAILQAGSWVIGNAPSDPRALTNSLVAGDFGLRFYAGIPLRTSDGYNLGTLCVLDFHSREITPQEIQTLEDLAATVMNELELRLRSRELAEQAAERERLNEAFVAMLSHELRTPVTTIYAASLLLARNPTIQADPRAQELLPDIVAESDRLQRLIEDLLVLTKVERDSLQPDMAPILLQRTLPTVVEREARRRRGPTIRLDLPSDLPPVAGDEVYVEQVTSNLLSNAIKYSPVDMPIDISAKRIGEDVEVAVRDRGMGLPAAQREAVFQLLVRTPDATRMAPGAGIGLYVCRRLMQAMGGVVWAEAAPEGGTVFTFRLGVTTG